MEEEIGIRVTRSRRRLSVEKSKDAYSPVGTPTKKKNTKTVLKPHLDNIGENEVVPSPKRTTRRSIASEPDEAVLTPSKRTTRVRSNTSLSSVVESPRALRITRRNSLLAESELANKVTPPNPKGSRRISQDFNSILKDDNGNTPKPSTMSSEQNISSPQTSTIVENEIDDLVSNMNDFTVSYLEDKMDRIEEEIFKISPQKTKDVNSFDDGLTNVDRFAMALLEINIETDTDKKTDSKVPSTTSPTPIRKSPRLKSKRDSKSQEELSSEVINKTNEEACENTDRQNNCIDSSDTVNTIKDVSEKVLLSQNIFQTRRSYSKNMSIEHNKSGFIDDNSNKIVSTNNSPAKEFNNIAPSYKENESLISTDKGNASCKSTLDESKHVSSNDSIIRQTPTSSKISSNASDGSRKSRNSFEKTNSVNISSESLKLRTSPEKKIGKGIIYSYKIDIHVSEENADHQNSKNKLDCQTFLHKQNSIEKKVAEEPMDVDVDDVGNGKVSLNENEIKSTSPVDKSNDNNINDIGKLSHQQSTRIFSMIIMDDEKQNEVARSSTENKKNPCNTVEELQEISRSNFEKPVPKPNTETVNIANISNIVVEELQEISKTHFEKSVSKPNAETVDDVLPVVSNIVAGHKAEKEKTSESKKDLNNSDSPNATEQNNEKSADDVACFEVENDTSEKLEDLSSRKSGKKQICSKSFSKNLVENSEVKYKLHKSLDDVSQFTPRRSIKSPKLGCIACSTPKANNSRQIKIPKKLISAPTNNKSVQLQSSDDDSAGPENVLLDNKAIDAGDDYESGDSLGTEEMEEMEQNEIREKGETLNSDDENTGDSEYEKDSFLASSEEEDEALLSGTGDDLDLSDNELNQSAKSKEKYNIRMSKKQKSASREMYEARHGITKNKKSQRKSSSRKIETDSSDSNDSEIILKKSANQSKMRLYSSCDISKSETEKEISNAQLINETIINDSHVKDPLSCTLPFKKRSLSSSSNQAIENVEDSSTVLRHNESQEGEIEQVEVDENKSVYLNGDKSIDPLSNTAYDDDDLSSLSSVDASVVDNYNSVLSVLNQSNKSCVKESSSDESDNKTNPQKSLTKTTEVIENAPSSGENEDKIEDKTSLDIPIVNTSTIDSDSMNASNLSLHTCDSERLNKTKKDSANENCQDLIESTIEDPVKEGRASEKLKSREMSILNNDLSTPDVDMHDLNDTPMSSNTKQDQCSEDQKFNTTEGDNIEIKSKKKRKKSFSNSSNIEVQNIISDTNNEEASEINLNNEVLKKSKDEMKTESLLEDGKEKLSKKTKNKVKNQSLNFKEVSNDSVIENESIIENLNLTISEKKEKKRSSIVNLSDIAKVCQSTKTSQINSDCVIEDKKKKNNNDNKKTNLGAAERAFIAEEDTKKSVKKKKKKDKLSNQSLRIVENSNDESFSANASVIDNLNLTIIKKKKIKNPTERKSKDKENFNKSVRVLSDIENIDSKADNNKEMNVIKNAEEFNSDTKLKKAKKKKSKNKSLNKDDSVDVSQASIDDNLNLTLPNTKTDIKKNCEHKNDAFYGETNKGKDRSVLVSAQTIKMCDGNSDDSNVRLLFSSHEEIESVSTKVKDVLSCTAMREDKLSEEDESCFPLKKTEAKTNLIVDGEGSVDDGAICGSTNCEKVNKKRKRNRNKKKQADHAEIEVANVTKIEKGICTEEPSMNDQSHEEKSRKKRRRKRKHIVDSETAEQNEGASKPQIQEAFLKNKVCTEQVVHEPGPKAKKRKLKEEPMAEHKKTKLSTTPNEQSTEIRRLPQTFLDQLSQSSKYTANTSQISKLTSTSKFKVDRANKRKAKPSEYLEQSILIGTEPTWTSNTGVIRTVKKPKLLPSIPTMSASGEGFTTQFKVVPLVGDMRKKDARMCSEHAIRNFRTDTLYGKKIKRITSEQLVRKRSNPQLW